MALKTASRAPAKQRPEPEVEPEDAMDVTTCASTGNGKPVSTTSSSSAKGQAKDAPAEAEDGEDLAALSAFAGYLRGSSQQAQKVRSGGLTPRPGLN